MKVAYWHSIGGASGDMLLAALLDAGLPLKHLEEDLRRLPIPDFQLTARKVQRHHVTSTHLEVAISPDERILTANELLEKVGEARLAADVRECATDVLNALLNAECHVHDVSRDELELHEIGSADTLIDVVGVVAGLKRLGIQKLMASPIVVGTGRPPRQRKYPTPAPATLELASMTGAPVIVDESVSHEMTTPTGAALLTTLAIFGDPGEITLHRIGYGAGSADIAAVPNVMAMWLGETADPVDERVVLLETNLDDAQGVVLGYAQERLFEQGALDVWFTPVQMKKNRPGVVLSALVPAALQEQAIHTILRETPTLGIRVRPVYRRIAERETLEFRSRYGTVRVKVKYLDGLPIAAVPEYEDCRALALEHGVSLQDLFQQVASEARSLLVVER